jgi:hypothetical protein
VSPLDTGFGFDFGNNFGTGGASEVGKVDYLDAQIVGQSTPPEAQAANDFFAEELTVRLRGRKQLPE